MKKNICIIALCFSFFVTFADCYFSIDAPSISFMNMSSNTAATDTPPTAYYAAGIIGWSLDLKDDDFKNNATYYYMSLFAETQFIGRYIFDSANEDDSNVWDNDIWVSIDAEILWFRPKFSYSLLNKDFFGSVAIGYFNKTKFIDNATSIVGFQFYGGLEPVINISEEKFAYLNIKMNFTFLLDFSRRKRYAEAQIENETKEQMVKQQLLLEQQRQEEENRIREERQAREEKEKQEVAKSMYESAKAQPGVAELAKYILTYEGTRYFDKTSYRAIAEKLTRNTSVNLENLTTFDNPYSFNKTSLYYVSNFSVTQWTGKGSFLSNLNYSDMIFIKESYDITAIGKTVKHAYLQYLGTYEYTAVSGAVTVVPMFNLLYSF